MAAALDAAELVEIDYEALPQVTTVADAVAERRTAALAGGARQRRARLVDADGRAGRRGHRRDLRDAAHVARVSVVNQRISSSPMEPRGATAIYDARRDHYTLRSCSQGATSLREQLVAVMGVAREQTRVMTDDVGGALRHEDVGLSGIFALLVAAKLTGRPVHWMSNALGSRFSPTTRRATRSPTPSSRSTRRASFSRCASGIWRAWAPTLRPPAPTSRPAISRAAFPACTTSPRCRSTCAASSPTRCRPGPIAAPDGPRPTT